MDDQNTSRERVELVRVARFLTQSLWRHEHWSAWALGHLTAGHARVGFHHLGHAEVSHLDLATSIQQNVVAGQVSVEDVVSVQVGEGQRDVVRDAHLHMVGERGRRALQEAREALFHQLHEEDGSAVAGFLDHPQELHDAGMLQVSQDAALLVEASGKVDGAGIIGSEENGVQDFGGAGQVVQRGSDDAAVGACPEDLGRVYVHFLVAEFAMKIYANVSLLRHCGGSTVGGCKVNREVLKQLAIHNISYSFI